MSGLVDSAGNPLPPEEAPSDKALRVYGDMAFLAFRSPRHAQMSVRVLHSYLEPPVLSGQFRVFRFDDVPRAMYTWAWLGPEAERKLIEGEYVKGLRGNLDYKVVYKSEAKQDDGSIKVSTEIQAKKKGRPYTITIDYVLTKRDGKLRCYDVITDGAGLVENYRAQFNKIIAKDGFDGLIAKMQKKLGAS